MILPVLAPLAWVYGSLVRARNARFDSRIPHQLRWPVISIGNLSVGGAGKTPLVICLARLLEREHYHVDVLSRGYGRAHNTVERIDPGGRAEQFGDEPLLIAQSTGVPVYVGASRYEAGLLAETDLTAEGRNVHLLDDGLQHRQLARAVDIVVLHRSDLQERLLPAGRLREPLTSLQRADVIVLRQEDAELAVQLRRYTSRDCRYWQVRRTLTLANPVSRALAFCAIARPTEFFRALTTAGVGVAERMTFRDHHRYRTADIERLAVLGKRSGCDAFITTQKDMVKLDALMRARLNAVAPLETAELTVEIEDEGAALRQLLALLDVRNHPLSPQNEQQRVLIMRLGAMGDILHALPAAAALRRAQPGWYLGWAVEPRWLALLSGDNGAMPLVNRTHLVDAKAWARAPFQRDTFRAISGLRHELRAERYDICIDLQGAVRSALAGRLASAPRMIGEDDPREWAARYLFGERVPTHGAHVIEQALEVCAAAAGEPLSPMLPPLPRNQEAEEWADTVLSGADERPIVLISPGAGWGAKRWPAERYGAVAGALDAQGCLVLVNAGPEEQAMAAEVVRASGGVAQAPPFTLERLIAVTRRVCLVIAGDTGPLHLACALGKSVVGIYGPTDPKRNGPFGVPFRVLRHPESKRDHTRHAEPEAGLLTITPEEVTEAAMDLLQEQRSAGQQT